MGLSYVYILEVRNAWDDLHNYRASRSIKKSFKLCIYKVAVLNRQMACCLTKIPENILY